MQRKRRIMMKRLMPIILSDWGLDSKVVESVNGGQESILEGEVERELRENCEFSKC